MEGSDARSVLGKNAARLGQKAALAGLGHCMEPLEASGSGQPMRWSLQLHREAVPADLRYEMGFLLTFPALSRELR